MGKRSSFDRRERDFYPTPVEAVAPLLPHLKHGDMFVEPCAGDGALVRHLEGAGLSCKWAADIEPRADWISREDALADAFWPHCDASVEYIITNPPWSRDVLHPLIELFSNQKPTWLLFDADWAHTRQAAPFASRLRRIVSVGRVKWIADSPFTGKDNCAWYLFDRPSSADVRFFMREAA
jgi:hypothetical protein